MNFNFINTLNTKPQGNAYAGNAQDDADFAQLIYHFTPSTRWNITGMTCLYTESKPTKEDISLLNENNITIIYSPDEKTAIIRHRTTRFTTTRTKMLWSLCYNQPAAVSFRYYSYDAGYPASIQNIQKQLSTHGVPVKLSDLSLTYTLTIPPCATGTEYKVPDLNWELYTDALRPYHSALRKQARDNARLAWRQPKHQLSLKITHYVNTWAPAYGIELPPQPEELNPAYDFQEVSIYQADMLSLYSQLRAYERLSIPMLDDFILCDHCHTPVHISTDETGTCSICSRTYHYDEWTEEYYFCPLRPDTI